MTTPILDPEEFESQVTWQEEPIGVRQLAKTLALPLIVKLDTGLYDNYGAGTALDTSHPYLLHSLQRGRRVVAANVVWDRQTRSFVECGSSLSIPVLYPGWFQPLSVNLQRNQDSNNLSTSYDGLRVTIREVANADISAFLSQGDLAGIRMPSGGYIRSYEKILCPPGEVFLVSGIFVEKIAQPSLGTQLLTWMCHQRKEEPVTTKLQYLQCCTSYGQELLIPFETVGKFYELGLPGTKDPRQVYQMQHLVRLIDMESDDHFFVKLIHGKNPQKHDSFSGILKLEEVVLQDSILACSIGEILPTLMEFPLHSTLSFICASEQSEKVGECANDVFNYMQDNLKDYLSRMKVVQKVSDGADSPAKVRTCKLSIKRNLPPLPRSTPDDDAITEKTDEYSVDNSYITDTEFSDDSDYDVIPVDDPLYQNQADVEEEKKVRKDSNFHGTATKLRAELLARSLSSLTEKRMVEDLYAKPVKRRQRRKLAQDIVDSKLPDDDISKSSVKTEEVDGQQLNAFLSDTLRELKRTRKAKSSGNPIMIDETSTTQAIHDFLDSVFDYDMVSTSTRSGHVLKIKEENELQDIKLQLPSSKSSSENTPPAVENHDQVSDLSSLYKKMPCTKPMVSSAQRLDSGLGETPRCSESSCCDVTPRILHWQMSMDRSRALRITDSDVTAITSWSPPDDIVDMTVEEVARSLRYIGIKAQHINYFLEEQIDGRQLNDLDDTLLKEGFPSLNALDRKKLLDFKAGWRPKRQFDSTSSLI